MQKAYAAHHRDPVLVQYASSGGVFAALAQRTLRSGGTVYGAAMQDGEVRCVGVTREEDLRLLYGSKYVFVPVTPMLEEIVAQIAAHKPVLVVTSPCQAAAVRHRCADSPLLTIVDFICHGAPEATLLHKYLTECGAAHGSVVERVDFRKKKRGCSWEQYETELHYANGDAESMSAADNPYMRLFLCNASLRRPCGACAWKGEHRESDLTLGDFWGVAKVKPSRHHREGTSLVLVNTAHGEAVWEDVQAQVDCEEVVREEALRYNRSALQAAHLHPRYEQFQRDCRTMTVEQLAERYAQVSAAQKAKRLVKHLLRRG